jgi:hypothetical protein
LASKGYQVLRFNTTEVREELTSYCVPKIVETVNRLGGALDQSGPPIKYINTDAGIARQFSLFEEDSEI